MPPKKTGGIELGKIPFNGRSFEEYCAIFDIAPEYLENKTVLDVAGGPSSFTAQARKYCRGSFACDPSYGRSADDLLKTGLDDIAEIREKIEPVLDMYKWDFYKSPDNLRVIRETTLKSFIADYSSRAGRVKYVTGELPWLPFADNSFDLVLCSHFLFLFSGRLGYDFHLESIKELARVSCGEVRVFPMVGLDTKPYAKMSALLDDLEKAGIAIEIRKIAFEFQRGANRTLVAGR
ncbi:hypothetical protein MNBD_NITROSPINAE04-1795 [hydrothermal vent metagenome]|uniref:Methyltransferase type 11 domain-containing protein n=1 Tax=hydrothermal vent metagenome TaxID=652676 RepID=A0A3B1C3D1_9ZZZZ